MPYKDPKKRREVVRNSVKKYRSKPENREKEQEYRFSAKGRDVNANAQRRWRWRHNKNTGDTRTEILMHVRDEQKYLKELERQVRAIYGNRPEDRIYASENRGKKTGKHPKKQAKNGQKSLKKGKK